VDICVQHEHMYIFFVCSMSICVYFPGVFFWFMRVCAGVRVCTCVHVCVSTRAICVFFNRKKELSVIPNVGCFCIYSYIRLLCLCTHACC